MGEAKRRRQLDPWYGKTAIAEIDGQPIRLQTYSGFIEIIPDPNNPDSEQIIFYHELDWSEFELDILSEIYAYLLPRFVDFYGEDEKKFRYIADFDPFKRSQPALIKLRPFWWEIAPQQKRIEKVAELTIKEIEQQLSHDNAGEEPRTHKSPREHTRSGHIRRVRCGKGRSQVKLVEIASTTVNQGVK